MTTRECKACDGLGTELGCSYFWDRETRKHMKTYCIVCNGSGSITERIPASDAIADAETLRLLGFNDPRIYANSTVARCLMTATFPYGLAGEEHNTAAFHAIWSARDAFRAVPGLRG